MRKYNTDARLISSLYTIASLCDIIQMATILAQGMPLPKKDGLKGFFLRILVLLLSYEQL